MKSILSLLNFIATIFLIKKVTEMEDKFNPLIAEVSNSTSVMQSAVNLITGLAERLDEAKDDPEQISAIVGTLRGQREQLAAAVVAHTPAAETDGPRGGTVDGGTGTDTGSGNTDSGSGNTDSGAVSGELGTGTDAQGNGV